MPAFTTAPSVWTNSSDANFRAWGSAVAAKLAAVGLVQTADTGQINWTTVTAPLAVDTYQGYEIWRFADALQATAPVFIKIQYGSGGTNANNPGMRFVFGSGSDGAGTLTGVVSTNLDAEATASAVPVTAYWSGSTNRFAMTVIGATSGAAHWLTFERSLDSLGAVTSEAVLWSAKFGITGTNTQQLAWDTTTGDKSSVETSLGILIPQVGTGVTGTQKAVYPNFHTKGVFMYPGMGLLGYFSADFASGSQVTVPIYGGTHVYMPMSVTLVTPTLPTRSGSSSAGIMVRYE